MAAQHARAPPKIASLAAEPPAWHEAGVTKAATRVPSYYFAYLRGTSLSQWTPLSALLEALLAHRWVGVWCQQPAAIALSVAARLSKTGVG